MTSESGHAGDVGGTASIVTRVRELLGRSAKWTVACIIAGLAAVVTSTTTEVGKSAVRSVQTSYCMLRIDKTPSTSRFRVVVARLGNDQDEEVQERIASKLVPTSFSVVRGCSEGPSTFDEKGRDFAEHARLEATDQLNRLSADVLIFGRVEGNKAVLRFADRNGYCSNVAKELPISDLDQEAARSAFAWALSDRIIKALVSDCEGKKLMRFREAS